MKRFLLLLAAVGLCLSAQGQKIPAGQEFRTGKLENGMSYYLCHNENPQGCAEFFIVHNVGALQEEDNQNGLAHFLEHMAFNGTRHYPGNSMLTFLAKDGVRFGYNVNAYTTRHETVYNISVVPLVRESFVDSVLLVLHDWSCDISCQQDALDAERGVITEEFRLRDDQRSRMARMQNDIIYEGAKHTQRSVIGTLDVINGFRREEILDFYHKWYRPDLQAIVIVGDFDVDAMEEKVKSTFADIPAPENAPAKQRYRAPHLDQPHFRDMTDNRIKFQVFKIFCKQPLPERDMMDTEDYLRDAFSREIVSAVLSARLNKAAARKDSPVRAAVLSTNQHEPDYYVSLFTITPKEKTQIPNCAAFTYREIRRLLLHGISRQEFEAARLSTAQRYHLDRFLDREEVKSESIVRVVVEHFLRNHPLVHPADMQDIQARVLEEIKFEDIASYPKAMFQDSEIICSTCYNPEQDPGIAPTPEQYRAIFTAVNAEDIGEDFIRYKTPDTAVTAAPGRIIKVAKKKDYEVWTLSNGARVYYKQAAPVQSNYHLSATWRFDTGRKSYQEDKITPSRMASKYLSQYLGFRGCDKKDFKNYPELSGFSYFMSSVKAEMNILAGKGKEENAFKTVFLSLSEPCFGEELESFKDKHLKALSREKTPRVLFDERCTREEFGNHPWLQVPDSADISSVDMALVEDVFRRKYSDPKRLSVLITSDLERSRIEKLVCQYVAPLTGDYPYKLSKTSVPTPVVKGKLTIEEEHSPEGEPLTAIYHAFVKKFKPSNRNLVVSDFLDYILSARYLNLIREDHGAAYHVGFSTVVPDDASLPWRGVVSFQTRPEMKETVLADVDSVMEAMCKEGPTAEEMEVAAKYILKRHTEEEAKVAKSISAQQQRLEYSALYGRNFNYDYKKMIGSITAADVRKMACKFASGDLILEVYTEQ